MDYLFKRWAEVRTRLINKYLFIFLDYDGTLAPIRRRPEAAVLSAETRGLLRRLAGNPHCKIAVISGRSLDDIKNRIGLKNIILSGNHGLEIEGPKIRFVSPVPVTYKKIIGRIKRDLSEKITPIKGAFIEDKGLSFTLHFRMVNKKNIPLVKAAFHQVVNLYLLRDELKVKSGKMSLEVRPALEWDKGNVVLWLLARQKLFRAKAGVLPVYIGDDLTDEDAFKAVRHSGITIFVGKPKPSQARYYLKNPGEVRELLKKILKLRKGTGLCRNL